MKPDHDASLREHLLELLKGGSVRPVRRSYRRNPCQTKGNEAGRISAFPWMLLEHLRIAQWDILEFSRNRKHVSPSGARATGREAEPRPLRLRGMPASRDFART